MEYKRITERVGVGVAVRGTSSNDNRSIWNAIERLAELEKGIINIAKERNKKAELASKFIDSYNDSLKQFAERLKEKLKEKVNADNVDVFVECAKLSDKTLKEFIK